MTLLDLAIGMLWVTSILLVIGTISFVVVMVMWESKRTYADLLDNPEILENLLHRGFDKAFIQITHRRSRRFIRFEKYLRPDASGVALAVPGHWPQDDKDALQRWCNANGLALEHREAADGWFELDCGQDTDRAHALACEVWFNIFGLTPQSRCKYTNQKMFPYDGLADSPGYATLTEKEQSERQIEFHKERHRKDRIRFGPMTPAGLGCFFFGIFMSAYTVSMFGLPISTLLAIGEPADWSLSMGAVTAAGSTASPTFFTVFLVSGLTIPLYAHGWTVREAETDTRKQQIAKCVYGLVMTSLPVAVVAVWIGG